MSMRVEDWRNVGADVVEPLLEAERARWIDALGWDPGEAFRQLEDGRSHGHVPGLVAFDGRGGPAGWTYFVVHNRTLQIGALIARSGDTVRLLLDHVLASPEARLATALHAFCFPDGSSVGSALRRRRFDVQSYHYLHADAQAAAGIAEPAIERIVPWEGSDLPAAVRLFARAYAGSGSARCFAPNGRIEEWAHYLAQLTHTSACGVFRADASFVIRDAAGLRLEAAIIATTVGPGMAHIAQVAVDPSVRRRGIGRQLVAAVARAAIDSGQPRLSLLVAGDNTAATALYERAGFAPGPSFLFACRPPLRRIARPQMLAAGATRAV